MIDILKKYNIKATKQRIDIYNYLENNKKVTLKDIIENNNTIDKSTIYRIIDLFIKKELILKIIDNDIIYYVLNDEHKHYLECMKCHKKEILDVCPYHLIDLKGFTINEEKVIKGICNNCQKRIGFLVGSFNPPTNSHFEIGHLLHKENILDEIVYVPCNSLSKKDILISITDRYNMLLEYTNNYDYLKVSSIEIDNGTSNFSYKEMDLLKNKYINQSLYIILGADNLQKIDLWDNYQYLLKNYNFIVLKRLNIDIEKIIDDKYLEYKDKFIIIDYNNNISSTIIRNNLKNNINVSNLLPKEVLNYIIKNNLY